MRKTFVYVRCEFIKGYKDGARIRVSFDENYISVSNNMLMVLKDTNYAVKARVDWSKNNQGTLNVLINTLKGTERKKIAIDDVVRDGEAVTQ